MTKQPKPSQPSKTMTNALGQAVPIKYVPDFDRERDKTARRILARFQKAQDFLTRAKAETLADIAALRGDGKNSNFQFQSFDGLIRVRYDARTLPCPTRPPQTA